MRDETYLGREWKPAKRTNSNTNRYCFSYWSCVTTCELESMNTAFMLMFAPQPLADEENFVYKMFIILFICCVLNVFKNSISQTNNNLLKKVVIPIHIYGLYLHYIHMYAHRSCLYTILWYSKQITSIGFLSPSVKKKEKKNFCNIAHVVWKVKSKTQCINHINVLQSTFLLHIYIRNTCMYDIIV